MAEGSCRLDNLQDQDQAKIECKCVIVIVNCMCMCMLFYSFSLSLSLHLLFHMTKSSHSHLVPYDPLVYRALMEKFGYLNLSFCIMPLRTATSILGCVQRQSKSAKQSSLWKKCKVLVWYFVGWRTDGGLAQLVERVLSMHEVGSSILPFSTRLFCFCFSSCSCFCFCFLSCFSFSSCLCFSLCFSSCLCFCFPSCSSSCSCVFPLACAPACAFCQC